MKVHFRSFLLITVVILSIIPVFDILADGKYDSLLFFEDYKELRGLHIGMDLNSFKQDFPYKDKTKEFRKYEWTPWDESPDEKSREEAIQFLSQEKNKYNVYELKKLPDYYIKGEVIFYDNKLEFLELHSSIPFAVQIKKLTELYGTPNQALSIPYHNSKGMFERNGIELPVIAQEYRETITWGQHGDIGLDLIMRKQNNVRALIVYTVLRFNDTSILDEADTVIQKSLTTR